MRYWAPAVLWIVFIFVMSGDYMSAPHTGSFIQDIFIYLLGHPLPAEHFETLHFLIRKGAHLAEYGILSALLFRAIRRDRTAWQPRWATNAIAVSMLVASLDELRQSFIPMRTGSPVDVAIDTAGAVIAQILIRIAQVLFFKS